MIHNYKHHGTIIDNQLTFTQYEAETERKVYSRFNMIKATTNPKLLD